MTSALEKNEPAQVAPRTGSSDPQPLPTVAAPAADGKPDFMVEQAFAIWEQLFSDTDHDSATSGRTEPAQIVTLRTADLRPSPENGDLYDLRIDGNLRDTHADIRDNGIREPLIVTTDSFILSGHRRHWCACVLGIETLPCIVNKAVARAATPPADYIRLLRSYNHQRDKSLAEQVREGLVDANPAQAHRELELLRLRDRDRLPAAVNIKTAPPRCRVSTRSQPLLDAALQVVEKLRPFWPTNLRAIHYRLLASPPVYGNHGGRPYANYRRCSDDLSNIMVRARLQGLVPWEAIADETRPEGGGDAFGSVREYVRWEAENMLADYVRRKLASQPAHIELVIEKNTLLPVVKPVAARYGITYTAMRGEVSLPPRRNMQQRFIRSGKPRMVVLTVTDLDPAGIDIEQTIGWSLRDEFGIPDLAVIRVAITPEQVREYQLPPSGPVKASASNGRRFREQYGPNTWEVEALDERLLQDILTRKIEEVLDVPLFNRELEAEAQDATELAAIRKAVVAFLAGYATPDAGGAA